MQWLIDIIKEWIVAQGYLKHGFVDRGDPAAEDFELADFTRDGNWHDLDLSSIVPNGAKAVNLAIAVRNIRISKYLMLRKNGNTNDKNKTQIRTQVADVYYTGDYVVALDAARIIEYLASTDEWNIINLTVKGWWF